MFNWEVLNGVGVDGVGVIFPFFNAIFPFFYAFSPFLLKDKGKQQQFTAKMGNFTPTPSAPTPCKTSRFKEVFGGSQNRERKLNTNFFFLKLFGHPRDIPAKCRDIPPKKFDSLCFEGHIELFGPHPFTWKTPTPLENIRTKKFGFGFLFLP